MTFSHSIGFRCTTDIGILTAKPKRKVIFPDSAPVARFIEKMAVRYRVKGTKYVLEVARYDEYRRAAGPGRPTQDPSKIHVPMSDIPFTSWGASLFNSNWDNLLGQHANLPVGGATRYAPSLGTFFPNSDTDTSDKSSSFSEFIELVRRVAELLGSGRAVGTVPSSKSSGTSTPSIAESEKSANSKHSAGREKKRDRMIDGDLGTLF